MSHPGWGRATLNAGGKLYDLVLDVGALCRFEEESGSTTDVLLVYFVNQRIGMRLRRALILAAAQAKHSAQVRTIEDVDRLMNEAGIGEIQRVFDQLVRTAFTDDEPAEGEQSQNPPNGAGAGRSSSSAGAKPASTRTASGGKRRDR